MKRKYRKISDFFRVTNVPDNNSDIDANNNDTPLDILDNEAGLEENAQDCEETESPPERSRERTTACRPANAEGHSRFNEEAAEASEVFPQKISQFTEAYQPTDIIFPPKANKNSERILPAKMV